MEIISCPLKFLLGVPKPPVFLKFFFAHQYPHFCELYAVGPSGYWNSSLFDREYMLQDRFPYLFWFQLMHQKPKKMIHIFLYLFNKYLLSTPVSGIALSSENTQ